jgi:hypothetical protein
VILCFQKRAAKILWQLPFQILRRARATRTRDVPRPLLLSCCPSTDGNEKVKGGRARINSFEGARRRRVVSRNPFFGRFSFLCCFAVCFRGFLSLERAMHAWAVSAGRREATGLTGSSPFPARCPSSPFFVRKAAARARGLFVDLCSQSPGSRAIRDGRRRRSMMCKGRQVQSTYQRWRGQRMQI